jgi:hypothetical protein
LVIAGTLIFDGFVKSLFYKLINIFFKVSHVGGHGKGLSEKISKGIPMVIY